MPSQPDKLGATIVIDAPNFFMACQEQGFHPSLRRLRNLIARDFNIVSTTCVFTMPIDASEDHRSAKLLAYCEKREIKTVVRELRPNDRKVDIDVEVAVEVIEASHDPNTRVIILVSGDRDFCHAVRRARKNGRHVAIISSGSSVAAPLLQAADEFVDINHIKKDVGGS